ncbi:hypothetical protein [Clostridium sp.]|uniref:DUF4139 domain-containing protein n=1 Tax=Clostridium sp. TaxID=1506 RepID=UPI002FC65CD1
MAYVSSKKDIINQSVVVYNTFGVVREERQLNLCSGERVIYYLDVSRVIEVDSIITENIEPYEINYDFDTLEPGKLLEKFLGKEVVFYDPDSNKKFRGILLSNYGGYIIKDIKTHEVYVSPKGEIILPCLPEGFVLRSTLILKILPTACRKFSLSYITGALNWSANYTVELHSEQYLDLKCWGKVTNNTGIDFKNTNLSLVAGDIKRVRNGPIIPYEAKGAMALKSSAVQADIAPASLGDYYIYNHDTPTDLNNETSKQIRLFSSRSVRYIKYYTNPYGSDELVTVIEFKNSKENNLGMPLPSGIAKVYDRVRGEGSLEFIGEDLLESTPEEELVKLELGRPFNIVFEKKQVDYKRFTDYEEYEYEILIKNTGNENAVVKAIHYIGGDWRMLSSTDRFIKKDANNIEFLVNVAPKTEKRIVFRYAVNTTSSLNRFI